MQLVGGRECHFNLQLQRCVCLKTGLTDAHARPLSLSLSLAHSVCHYSLERKASMALLCFVAVFIVNKYRRKRKEGWREVFERAMKQRTKTKGIRVQS